MPKLFFYISLILVSPSILAQTQSIFNETFDDKIKNQKGISDLTFSSSGVLPGQYTITDSAQKDNPYYVNPINSNGNFLIVDANENSGKRMWYTKIKIKAYTSYLFSYQACNIAKDNPSILQITLDGIKKGYRIYLPLSHEWVEHKITFLLDKDSEVTLAIVNINSSSYGNDLAIDNISLLTLDEKSKQPEMAPITEEKFQLDKIYFELGKSTLLNKFYPELDNLVDYLNKHPKIRIRIEGHTSNQGDSTKNIVLSENRVMSIKKYIVQHGISEDRIDGIGYGSNKPAYSNQTEELSKLNRRVEIILLR